MLRFLRNIRKSSLASASSRKYFIYAIGEIALVVIGILLALQINKWSEAKKLNKSINSHLQILAKNLEEDQIQLKQLHSGVTDNFAYADSLMMFFKGHVSFDSKIVKYMSMSLIEHQFKSNTTGFETINQSGEIPFLNAALQSSILDYYSMVKSVNEREHISNKQIQEKYEVYIFNNYPEVFQRNNEWEYVSNMYKDDLRPIIDFDPVKLRSDKTLEANIIARHYQSNLLSEQYSQLIEASNKALSLIQK